MIPKPTIWLLLLCPILFNIWGMHLLFFSLFYIRRLEMMSSTNNSWNYFIVIVFCSKWKYTNTSSFLFSMTLLFSIKHCFPKSHFNSIHLFFFFCMSIFRMSYSIFAFCNQFQTITFLPFDESLAKEQCDKVSNLSKDKFLNFTSISTTSLSTAHTTRHLGPAFPSLSVFLFHSKWMKLVIQ